eukprot:scaffold37672_cov76-Phaeocystis_antarctica.AAC.2
MGACRRSAAAGCCRAAAGSGEAYRWCLCASTAWLCPLAVPSASSPAGARAAWLSACWAVSCCTPPPLPCSSQPPTGRTSAAVPRVESGAGPSCFDSRSKGGWHVRLSIVVDDSRTAHVSRATR